MGNSACVATSGTEVLELQNITVKGCKRSGAMSMATRLAVSIPLDLHKIVDVNPFDNKKNCKWGCADCVTKVESFQHLRLSRRWTLVLLICVP